MILPHPPALSGVDSHRLWRGACLLLNAKRTASCPHAALRLFHTRKRVAMRWRDQLAGLLVLPIVELLVQSKKPLERPLLFWPSRCSTDEYTNLRRIRIEGDV